jgi:hypothetical protein
MFFLLLGALPWFAIPAQRAGTSLAPASDSADDRVLNCPYSAQRRFTSVERLADGTSRSTESGGSEARDSKGRTYSAGERHWTYVDHGKPVLKSEMLYRIHDPVSNTDTSWDSTSKEAKVIHWPKGAPRGAFGVGAFLADVPGTVTEKLGLRTIDGVVAEGTRSAYTVAGEQDEDRKPMSVVHESWYCPELKIVVLETNDDPRRGTTRNELVGTVRGEPDVKKYRPPADYVIHDLRPPAR